MSNRSVRVFKKKKVQQSDGNVMQPFIRIKSLVFKTFYLPRWILVKEALNMLQIFHLKNKKNNFHLDSIVNNIVHNDFHPLIQSSCLTVAMI